MTPERPSACSSSSDSRCSAGGDPHLVRGRCAGQCAASGTGDLADPRRQPASPAPHACAAHLALAAVGSVLGVAWVSFRRFGAVRRCSGQRLTGSLLVSALLGAGVGFLATGVALYAAGRRAITRQISDERAQLASRPPLWRLLGIDFLILGTVAAVEWYQRRHGGFEGVRGSVYFGRSVSCAASGDRPDRNLARRVLVLGEVVEQVFAHLPLPRRRRFGRPLRGLLTRSIRRRSWAAASAVIMVGLIVALGTSVASFSASYNQAKA